MNGAKNCTEIKNQIIAEQSERRKMLAQREKGSRSSSSLAQATWQLLMNTLIHMLQSELSGTLKKIHQ